MKSNTADTEMRTQMMRRLQEVGMTINDLNEYLDTHLYDSFAIERLNEAVADYQKLLQTYSENYGPLQILSGNSDSNAWLWGLNDFPWDY